MSCEAVQRAIGEAMDERRAPSAEAEAHRRTCPACAAFSRGAWRVRELSRLEVAPPVPDLVPAILVRVAAEERLHLDRRRRMAALALAAGLVIGFLLTAGSLVPIKATNTAALADSIPSRLVRAAVTLEGYRATFDITERNWTRDVPVRTFVADLAFAAPESFRVHVQDTTDYPSGQWPRNDLLLVTDGRTWRATGPDPCPQAALPACPWSEPVDRSLTRRAPFDSRTAAPTDVIVPMTVLAASNQVTVVGSGDVAGKDAVAVELDFQDAAPLFDYLRFLGSWRPFFPRDRVVIWLDRTTWFPLRYQVFPAPGAERATWAAQAGFPIEPSSSAIFSAQVRTISDQKPPARRFVTAVGPNASDQGFLESAIGPNAPTPASTAGLTLWRFGRFPMTTARPYELSVLAYARGLSWLTVTRVDGWNRTHLFGVGPYAEEVRLSPGGVGYYEPASATEARRIAMHTREGEFLIESNLPRSTLLSVAGSIPVTGEAGPASWRLRRWASAEVEEGLTPDVAVSRAGFEVLLPAFLPQGYAEASAMTVRTPRGSGLAILYRRPAAELGGTGLRLYQSTGETLPPPTGADEQVVRVAGSLGRWSPEAHVLDWVDGGGVYRSLSGPGFDLTTLLEVAASLRPAA